MLRTTHFAHVLLFACQRCDRPIASVRLSAAKDLEVTDAAEFVLRCQCGWTGQILGARAVKHWVESWGVSAVGAG
jgi:hypothetical protein